MLIINVNCWKRSKISVACIIVYPNSSLFLLAVLLVHTLPKCTYMPGPTYGGVTVLLLI